MKKYILLIIPFIISCSSPEPINADVMLIERGGEYFSAAKNKPYSGPFFTLHGNGELKSEGNLKKGNLVDTFKEYLESGQILKEVIYKNGVLNGTYKEYFEGNVLEKGTYKNGKKDGPYTAFGLDSEVVWKGKYNNGESDAIEYYKASNIENYSGPAYERWEGGSYTGFLLNGKQHGLVIEINQKGSGLFSDESVRYMYYSYKNGESHGPQRTYFLKGKLHSEYTTKNGEMDGSYKRYFENGQLRFDENYKDGKRHGPFKRYHENGQLRSERTFKDDKEDGVSKSYNSKGKIWEKATYRNGKQIDREYYD